MLDLCKLEETVRYEGGVSRRLFLAYVASLSAVPRLGRKSTASAARGKVERRSVFILYLQDAGESFS